jgi:hypothetical protein
MNGDPRLMLRWPVAVAIGIVLLAGGAGGAYLLMRPPETTRGIWERPREVAKPLPVRCPM